MAISTAQESGNGLILTGAALFPARLFHTSRLVAEGNETPKYGYVCKL